MSDGKRSNRASRQNADAAAAAPTDKSSVWEDFIDIIFSPASVFARRQNSGFWIPLLVVTLAVGGIMYANAGVMEPAFDAEYDRTAKEVLRSNPKMTQEMMDQGRKFAAIFTKTGALLFTPIAIFLIGITVWAVGKLFSAQESFKTAIVVAAYSYVPRVVEAILFSAQGALLDTSHFDGRLRFTLGVGRFLNPDTMPSSLLTFLGRIDLITIWVTVLLAIGLAVTGRISRGRAAMAGVVIWLAGALPLLIQALRS